MGFVWAFAFLNILHLPLREAIASSSLPKISELRPQVLSNTAWACATLSFVHSPLLNAIAAEARTMIQVSKQPQDLGRLARSFWVLTYDHGLWGPMLTTHLAMMEEDLVLGTLDRIPRKFGVSKEAMRDRSLLPEGYQATTNWWKSAQVAPRPRSTVEVPGITDRRFVGLLAEMREIGGEAAYGFINCPELKSHYGRDVFVKNCHTAGFKVGDTVSFRVVFKKERHPEAVELGQPSDASLSDPLMVIRVDAQELTRKGYLLQTVRIPDTGAAAAQPGDVVCVSYVGRLASDRTIFDAASNLRFVLGAGSVIPGWDKGIADMRVGQEARLIVHHSYAYGEVGAPTPEPVPPFANLDFSLTLHDVVKPDAPPDDAVDFYSSPFCIDSFENIPEVSGIAFFSGSEMEASGSKDGEWPQAGCDALQPKRGRRWRSLMIEAMNHSIKSWLLSIDKQGSLLEFQDKLQREHTSVNDIVSVYTKVGPDGSTSVKPEFFETAGVTGAAARRLFQAWFEGAAPSSAAGVRGA